MDKEIRKVDDVRDDITKIDYEIAELFEKTIGELNVYSHLNEKEKDIYARFFAYGLTGVIVDWAMRGMKENEDEVSKTLQNMVLRTEEFGHEIYLYRQNGNLSK